MHMAQMWGWGERIRNTLNLASWLRGGGLQKSGTEQNCSFSGPFLGQMTVPKGCLSLAPFTLSTHCYPGALPDPLLSLFSAVLNTVHISGSPDKDLLVELGTHSRRPEIVGE